MALAGGVYLTYEGCVRPNGQMRPVMRAQTARDFLIRAGLRDFYREQFARFGDLVDCHQIPIEARISEIFGTEDDFGLLLRPDNHIAFIASGITPEHVAGYLGRL